MRSGNPVLNDKTFDVGTRGSEETMTLQGTVTKTWILLALVVGAGSYSWSNPTVFLGSLWVWALLGFAFALVTCFKKNWSPMTAPMYAIVEGLLLGALSLVFEKRYPGIVIQSVSLTFGILAALLLAYKSKLIQVTQNFRLGMVAATGGIMIVYLVDLVLRFWGKSIPLIHESGPVGILFSLFVVVIASFNLVLDFDFIEKGSESGAPKYMEWFGAFGLIVTLIWLYLEILRLLGKSRSRN